MGIAISMIHKKSFRGAMYNPSFAVSLGMLTVITSFVILTITSNIVLSLGMVGALSIVRFRTAVKDSIDILFMFWAISSGIIIGAGIFYLALVEFAVVWLIMFILSRFRGFSKPYLLILQLEKKKQEPQVMTILKGVSKKSVIKSREISQEQRELTIEIFLKGNQMDFMDEILDLEGIQSASLLSYDGEFSR